MSAETRSAPATQAEWQVRGAGADSATIAPGGGGQVSLGRLDLDLW